MQDKELSTNIFMVFFFVFAWGEFGMTIKNKL